MKKEGGKNVALKKEKNFVKKPFLMGFVVSIVFLVLLVLSFIFSFFGVLQTFVVFASFLNFILYLVILSSFYYLGKKYESKLLRATVIVMAIIVILFSLIGLFLIIKTSSNLSNDQTLSWILLKIQNKQQLTEQEVLSLVEAFRLFFVFGLISFLFYAVVQTVFSVGIMRLSEVSYNKAFSILNIICSWLPVTLIGIIVFLPTYIAVLVIQILLFYKQTKKFGEIKNNGKS